MKSSWDDSSIEARAFIIAYSQIREIEESKLLEIMLKCGVARMR